MQKTRLSGLKNKSTDFNWSIVTFLIIMIGIPAIPGLIILVSVLFGTNTSGQVSSIVNPRYFDQPSAIIIHAGAGLLFFLSVPFQFSGALRLKKPQLHKISGYLALVSGCLVGLSGVWMHHFLNDGVIDVRYIALGIQGISLCAAFAFAVKHIFKRNIKNHRIWMSRAVAIALSLVTLVFIEVVFLLILSEHAQTNESLIQLLHNFGNLIGMTINLLVVEYYFKNKINQ